MTIRFSDDIAARLEGPQLRDPKDEMVLETTMNGQADALVTFNVADFRDAMTRFSPRRDDAFGISWRTGENVMSNFALRLPESLHAYAKKLAQEGNTSLNQFIVMAVAEKVSALNTEAFFKERAARGTAERFLEIMKKVPDNPPQPGDERSAL
ncbi:MAG: toxin-antitoxin system HicB family antitoxin [Thauera sp.]|nr:toxin-antitoxin system HicB family antitoxin [Thauera sp.]